MTDREQLAGLIARVEAATGRDPTSYDRFGYDALVLLLGRDEAHAWLYHTKRGDPATSLDTALALVDRVLPETMWQVGFDPDDGSMCARLVTAPPPCTHAKANHDTATLALILALLRALLARAIQHVARDGATVAGPIEGLR